MTTITGYVPSYVISKAKNNQSYVKCDMFLEGGEKLRLTVWSDMLERFEAAHKQSKCLDVYGEISSFDQSYTISYVVSNSEVSMEMFVDAYDVAQYVSEFTELLSRNLAEKYAEAANLIITTVGERFFSAMAAIKYHDAMPGGLFMHTLKMLRICEVAVRNDARLVKYKDLLFLGILCHDMAKTVELEDYQYTEIGAMLGHKVLGVRMLETIAKPLCDLIGEAAYITLLSIMMGHHGDFDGDKPRSVAAYLVFCIDNMESKLTGLMDACALLPVEVKTVKFSNLHLQV